MAYDLVAALEHKLAVNKAAIFDNASFVMVEDIEVGGWGWGGGGMSHL